MIFFSNKELLELEERFNIVSNEIRSVARNCDTKQEVITKLRKLSNEKTISIHN